MFHFKGSEGWASSYFWLSLYEFIIYCFSARTNNHSSLKCLSQVPTMMLSQCLTVRCGGNLIERPVFMLINEGNKLTDIFKEPLSSSWHKSTAFISFHPWLYSFPTENTVVVFSIYKFKSVSNFNLNKIFKILIGITVLTYDSLLNQSLPVGN